MSFLGSQSIIYKFFMDCVKTQSPEVALQAFKETFFLSCETLDLRLNKAIYEIVFENNKKAFRNTLKRVCYILINNWLLTRNYTAIQKLIQLIEHQTARISTKLYLPYRQKRLCQWLVDFVNSEDYQQLCLYDSRGANHWSYRYTAYLLVPQYLAAGNMIEQRKIARTMAQQLKEKFKRDLAMYTAHFNPSSPEEHSPNPTQLGKDIINVIKVLTPSHKLFGYENYARIFLLQEQKKRYKDFKLNLPAYLAFNFDNESLMKDVQENLSEKLKDLYQEHDEDPLNFNLLLRTCKKIIQWLTTQDGQQPSELFVLLMNRGGALTTSMLLVKIILICRYAQSHLESCVARLIHYYGNFSEDECQWFIEFIEFLTVLLAVYAENVHYDLVNVNTSESGPQDIVDLNRCRLFPQLRGLDLRRVDLHSLNLQGADLSCANLSHADLSEINLTGVNLNFAKLVGANLSHTILKGAKLTVADLRGVDLSYANLDSADLRRANLQRANLCHASLRAAKLSHVNLAHADLKQISLRAANLTAANLNHANLQAADLHQVNLSKADLESTNLRCCNLKDANLHMSKLYRVNLMQGNLVRVDLRDADLRHVNLSKARLTHSNLSGADLSKANLEDAILDFTNLKRVSLYGADLERADCSHADLRLGNLSGADLSGVMLRHAKIEGADLAHANLSFANLFDTQFNQVNVKDAQFIKNSGISDGVKSFLEQQGAIVST